MLADVPAGMFVARHLAAACVPQRLGLAVLPSVLARLPRRADGPAPSVPSSAPSSRSGVMVLLACAAGAALALAYSSVEQLVVPVRGSQEFGLDRAGIAR